MKELFRKIFHKRIKPLTPVVAMNENADVIYGRYDCYNKATEDNPHSIVEYVDIFHNCFYVKTITEMDLVEFIKLARSEVHTR